MNSRTMIRSWRAIALAGLFLGGTCFVLFQDIIQGAAVSTSHVLTSLALIAATAAGHACVPVWREHRFVLALGLAIVAVAGLGYIVTMSGARNAESTAAKAGTVVQNNADRAKLETEIAQTKADLKELDDAAARECASGKGKKCDGRVTTADRTRSHLALIEVRQGNLKPAAEADAGYKHLAKLWTTALGGEPKAIEQNFVLYMPFIAVLITELGTIVFLSLGLGHSTVQAGNDNRPAERPSPPRKGRGRKRDQKVVDWVAAFRQRHGRDPMIPEVQAAFPAMPTSTCQRYRKSA